MRDPMEGRVLNLSYFCWKCPHYTRFTGQDPEPRPGLSAGHIPYSLSLPFTTFLETHQAPNGQSYTSFLPKDKILEALEGKIGAKNTQDVLEGKRSIVASCGSGMTAGVLWLGLSILGVKSPAIYDEVMLFHKCPFPILLNRPSVLDGLRYARVK